MNVGRRPSHSRLAFTLSVAALTLSACSAEDDVGSSASQVPPFQGGVPSGASPSPSAPAPSGAGGAPGQTAGTPEQQPGDIPLASGGAGSAAPAGAGGANPPAAAGGSGGAPGPAASGGTGGGAMVGAAGGTSLEPDPGEPTPPEPAPVADPFPAPNGPACGPASFFCETFEGFAVGTAQQNALWRPEGNASIDGQASQGARALHLQPGGGQFARIALNNFSAPGNSLFGRMFLRIEALPSAPNFAHWVVVEATGSGSSERVRPLGGQFIDLQDRGIRTNFWGVGADGGPTGDWTHWDNGGLVEASAGQYQCIEWRMNGADSAIDVWIDEEFQPSMSVSRDDNPRGVPFVFPTFNNMTIGWGVFQGGTTPGQFDVHIDDIVLSRERAGCN